MPVLIIAAAERAKIAEVIAHAKANPVTLDVVRAGALPVVDVLTLADRKPGFERPQSASVLFVRPADARAFSTVGSLPFVYVAFAGRSDRCRTRDSGSDAAEAARALPVAAIAATVRKTTTNLARLLMDPSSLLRRSPARLEVPERPETARTGSRPGLLAR